MMGIDLNAMEEEEEEEAAEHLRPPPAMCLELWHACAGPLISLPKKGSVVVYLPQGHLEHLGESMGSGYQYESPLSSQVFCRVVDLKLHADANTDEVYARLYLVAENEEIEKKLSNGEMDQEGETEEVEGGERSSVMPHMFCKTLTASDTSTHGGFSVPRRAAEDCFPPLDYVQQRPSQELIAKDLHGVEWRFRHIYRGQPRRHLLTTGWSAFVNKKKLVSGDAVLFLRGDDGELRLGIRRAVQLKNGTPIGDFVQNSNLGAIQEISRAISAKREFQVYYNPRSSSSDFIIPLGKFARSFIHPLSIGTRFKTRYETEDSAERRCTGMITGIGEADPARWPGSKWRCLHVRWDNSVNSSRENNRLSPWDIEPIGTGLGSHSLSVPSSKRSKICLNPTNLSFPTPGGVVRSDLVESIRFHKVLQGQEFKCPNTALNINPQNFNNNNNHINNHIHNNINNNNNINNININNNNINISYPCTGFGDSMRFQKVLQGQEIYPQPNNFSTPFMRKDPFTPLLGSYPPWSVQASSPSSVLVFQNNLTNYNHNNVSNNNMNNNSGEVSNESFEMGNVFSSGNCKKVESEKDCRLFGFSLNEKIRSRNEVDKGESGNALFALCATPL
ncbi:hypothetical protein LUZ60_000621 [Juncus effusus]|nr:hypothetical protein LUZ60_000621 [Juncus effusus]